MKPTLLFTLAVLLTSCGINRNVYKSNDFEQQATRHKTVAILPLKITQTGHVAKRETEESIRLENEKWGYAFQETLFTYTLRQSGKRRKSPVVEFQAIQKTNALLKEAGLTIEEAYQKQPESLARLLNVDAVLMTTLQKDRNFSDGVAYGLAGARAIIDAVSKSGTPIADAALDINASDLNMNSYLYNGADSKLLWKTFRRGGANMPHNINGVVEFYSHWIARKLPYRS